MQLQPMYDGPSPLVMDGPADALRAPLVRQRRRLAEQLGSFTDEQWRVESRCAGWSAHDVIAHLVGTNQFWTLSITAGVAGEPTRFLASFDPAATPPQLIEPMRALPPAEVLARFVATNEELFAAVESLDESGWAALAESPPGHVPIGALASHALWDSWVHERDILLPLGLSPVEEPDEITECLRYAAALSPVFSLSTGSAGRGALVVDVSDPDIHVVVEVDDAVAVHAGDAPTDAVVITGDAVELVEAFSIRQPLDAEVPVEARWLVTGLAEAFDAAAQG
jgi:uncharacterized protein (TIGR03083 family)